MNNLIHIVGNELQEWSDDSASDRSSMLTQHLMLAEMISKHEHLNIRLPSLNDDNTSYHSADSQLDKDSAKPVVYQGCAGTQQPPKQEKPKRHRSPRPKFEQGRSSPSSDWSWRPAIPHRTSSMSTRRRKGNSRCRPDLATFHRRSCQLFSSLDSTLSSATSSASEQSRSSTSTSPSLTSSVTTQDTLVLDNNECSFDSPRFPSFQLELDDTYPFRSKRTSRLGSRRSSSQLNPAITSTEQLFWTSDSSREEEYAKIDAAHTGLKGLVKRVLPKTWKAVHGKRRNFHQKSIAEADQASSTSDGASVRRYRIESVTTLARPQPDDRSVTPMPRLDLETGHVATRHARSGAMRRFAGKFGLSRSSSSVLAEC